MISVIMPQESWVAKWNDLTHRMPGVYAMYIIDNDIAEQEKQRNNPFSYGDEDDNENQDWIVDDGEGEEEYRQY